MGKGRGARGWVIQVTISEEPEPGGELVGATQTRQTRFKSFNVAISSTAEAVEEVRQTAHIRPLRALSDAEVAAPAAAPHVPQRLKDDAIPF
jgi:hypothetical protein